jgi:hypothetical protein
MSKKINIKYAVILLFLLPSLSFAVPQLKEYTIVKGDTLWDISERELKDPFMWPNIWKENTWIDDPHWIYPGQVIKIPLLETTAQEPIKKEELTKEPAVMKYPLVSENAILRGGYLVDTLPGIGKVGDGPSGNTLFGEGDTVFIETNRSVKKGDRFFAIRASKPVIHPVKRKNIGYVITISGILEVVQVKHGDVLARITKSFEEIEKGDSLDSFYEVKPVMTTGQFRCPDIRGMIIAAKNEMMFQSMLDVIFIDKGSKDGIEPGDMFRTIAVGAHAIPNGVIQIISTREHTATAIIQNSNGPVVPGNIFVKLDKSEIQ